jgi:BlaI family transcriptional regulator, penicillinase repressor
MTPRNTPGRPLTELQQAILDFIWENGPVTSEEVREAIHSKHPLKDPSVRTLLRRLEERGYITHRVEGKVFKYRAKVHSRGVAARVVAQMIQRLCSGSAEQFLLGLVDERVLSADDIDRLAKKVRKEK